MIRVAKPEQAPRILRERGKLTTEENQSAFEAGVREFTFDSSLYGAKSVKTALIDAQRGKCAFCESQVRHIAHGDVEHYRPKGGVRQRDGDPLEQPGYFWLAYVWENLFFACQLCNQSFKQNLFPLADPVKRARSHRDDLTAEEPMLLHPAGDDPSELIGFRGEIAFPIDDDPRARTTIEVLGLNRGRWRSSASITSSHSGSCKRFCGRCRWTATRREASLRYLRRRCSPKLSTPA